MRALLDVNVLIALLDAQHVHHENARQGRFVTFDARIAPDSVVGARDPHYCAI